MVELTTPTKAERVAALYKVRTMFTESRYTMYGWQVSENSVEELSVSDGYRKNKEWLGSIMTVESGPK